jgi:mono/diheme cytochrome c family protein
MKRTLWIAIAGLAVGWNAMAAGLSPEDTAAGRKLYQTKCGRCHKFYNIDNYPDPAWAMWLEKMTAKARLTPQEASLLGRYLQTLRPSHPPTGTAGDPSRP